MLKKHDFLALFIIKTADGFLKKSTSAFSTL
jgi:hypothetical protein